MRRRQRRWMICVVAMCVGLLPTTASAGQRSWDELRQQVEMLRREEHYGEAIAAAKEALKVAEEAPNPDQLRVAAALNDLANLYRALADAAKTQYLQSTPLYERALALMEKNLGPNHSNVAITLNNLAALYVAQGEYGKAEAADQRALTIWESTLGFSHPNVGILLTDLAQAYSAEGKYKEAEAAYQRAVGILTSTLGSDHPLAV